MNKKSFDTEKKKLYTRISKRMQKALSDLGSREKLVRDMEASLSPKNLKEPPYK